MKKKLKLCRETNTTTSNILQRNISEKNIKILTQEYSLKFDNTTYIRTVEFSSDEL